MTTDILLCWEKDCIYAKGPAVEHAATRDLAPDWLIPHQKDRQARDGAQYHITLLRRKELSNFTPKVGADSEKSAVETLGCWLLQQRRCCDRGVGLDLKQLFALLNKAEEEQSTFLQSQCTLSDCAGFSDLGWGQREQVYFKVLYWPLGERLRAVLGLSPKAFHITVGFARADRHDIDKGVRSLVLWQAHSASAKGDLNVWPSLNTTVQLSRIQDVLDRIQCRFKHQTCAPANSYSVLAAIAAQLRVLSQQEICPSLRYDTLDQVELLVDEMKTHAADWSKDLTDYYHQWLIAMARVLTATEYTNSLTKVAQQLIKCQPNNPIGYVSLGHAWRQKQAWSKMVNIFWAALVCIAALLAEQQSIYRDDRNLIHYWLVCAQEHTEVFLELVLERDIAMRTAKTWAVDRHAAYPQARAAFCSYLADVTAAPADACLASNLRWSALTPGPLATERRWLLIAGKEPFALPRFFSWLVPGFLAGMSTPRHVQDLMMLHQFNISLIITATEEQPLSSEWFDIVNQAALPTTNRAPLQRLFLPTRNYDPPSEEQIYAFLFAVAREQPRMRATDGTWVGPQRAVVVHCGGGKGRAGCFLAAYLLRYGAATPWPLCAACRDQLERAPASLTDLPEHGWISCTQPDCVHARPPSMTVQQAIDHVRQQRPGSIETLQQETFLRRLSQQFWAHYQRATALPICDRSNASLDTAKTLSAPSQGPTVNMTLQPPVPAELRWILLVGLPGSGKSWFAARLAKRDPRWRIISQDEAGGRAAFERALAQHSQLLTDTTDTRLIIDRCHIDAATRMRTIEIGFKPQPQQVAIVYLATPPAECGARAQQRIDHPTLRGQRAHRVIHELYKRLEPPSLDEGIANTIWRVDTPQAVQHLLDQLTSPTSLNKVGVSSASTSPCSHTPSESPSQLTDVTQLHPTNVIATTTQTAGLLGMTAASRQPLHPDRPPMPRPPRGSLTKPSKPTSTASQTTQRVECIKYPRTQHLINLGAATDDDLVLSHQVLDQFLALALQRPDCVTIEEKLDGANLGIQLVPDWTPSMPRSARSFLVQNRSHFIHRQEQEQFKPLDAFLYQYHDDLVRLLTEPFPDIHASKVAQPGERILFGEWLAARHSVFYTRLPAYFVPFDLFEVSLQRFWSRQRFNALRSTTQLPAIPHWSCTTLLPSLSIQSVPSTSQITQLRDALLRYLDSQSAFGDELLEGIVIRIDDNEHRWLRDKAKLVRAGFIAGCATGHWSRRARIEWNRLASNYTPHDQDDTLSS